MINFFLIACAFRLISQMLWRFIGTNGYAGLYAIGLAVFELAAIILVIFPPKQRPKKWQQGFLIYFGLCAMWDFVKYLWFDPYEVYFWDYANIFTSFIATLISNKYVFRYSNR